MQRSTVESFLFFPEQLVGDRQVQFAYTGELSVYMYCKRVFDVAAALVVVLAIYPFLFPIIALLIRIDSRGPVFFRQKRSGYMNRPFWCYKFRTMYVNDSSDTCRAEHNDPRVTRVGRILRNTCLDELPQFINVLLGDMSIVGPRPHMLKDSREFSAVVEDYRLRHMVRPGITGLSQVRGYRGPAMTFESIFRRWQWDVYYVRNCSFKLDCRIMFGTVVLIVRSVFFKDKPVPLDQPVFKEPGQAGSQKIA